MKLRRRHEISLTEERVLREVLARQKSFEARKVIVHAGDELTDSMCLLEGFTYRFKDMRSGERQVLELNVPGDFIDLHGFVLKRLDHGIESLTRCRLALVSHDDIQRISVEHPRLARIFWFLTALDAAIHRAWVTSLGRRSATERFAHLFCELKVRLGIVGMTDDDSFDLPMTQADLSDLAGLSAVHTSRSLQTLRKQGLVNFNRGRVEILDYPALARLAQFDPSYLYDNPKNLR